MTIIRFGIGILMIGILSCNQRSEKQQEMTENNTSTTQNHQKKADSENSSVAKPAISFTSKFTPVAAIFGPTNPDEATKKADPVQRFSAVVELNPEKEKLYRELHADVWPEVKAAIKKANIQNFNIFITEIDGKKYLFNYLEYVGTDIEKDLGGIALDSVTREKWWPITDACQIRLPGTPEGEQWRGIEMVMHIK